MSTSLLSQWDNLTDKQCPSITGTAFNPKAAKYGRCGKIYDFKFNFLTFFSPQARINLFFKFKCLNLHSETEDFVALCMLLFSQELIKGTVARM